jgi:hypothetical protein
MRPSPLWTGGAVLLVALGGCSRDVRLSGRKLRTVTVGTKSHYGVKLDPAATPEQVAYVLLRAIRDDFQARTSAEREAALDVQFDLAAVNVIGKHNRARMNPAEFLYNVVYRWTPTVSHYVSDFETDFDRARPRLLVSDPKPAADATDGSQECEVRMEVRDPGGDPNARAVMVVYLSQDSGYWRVLHLGFDPRKRTLGG